MATISLHPAVRERSKAQLSANQLAEYVVYGIDRAHTIVHDAKFVQAFIPSWYDDSQRAVVDYLTDPLRNKQAIYDEIDRLAKVVASAESADVRDRANLDVAVLEQFLRIENQLGLKSLGFLKPPGRCAPLLIEKVLVSVQPDVLVHPLVVAGTKSVGAVIFRFSKGVDPESARKEATREKRREERREMGRYVAVLASMLLEKQFAHLGEVSPKHCIAIDIPLGEAIPLPGDRNKRTLRLKKACTQIAQTWPNVDPKPGICA